jgi:hypothetical protein
LKEPLSLNKKDKNPNLRKLSSLKKILAMAIVIATFLTPYFEISKPAVIHS